MTIPRLGSGVTAIGGRQAGPAKAGTQATARQVKQNNERNLFISDDSFAALDWIPGPIKQE
jgi:hypothetical protein